MDVLFTLSLLLTFLLCTQIEIRLFKGGGDWVTRALRSFGMYVGMLAFVSYNVYLLTQPLSPLYFVAFAGTVLLVIARFSPRVGATDFNFGHALPAALILVAAFYFLILPSLPGPLPISYGVDAYWHYEFAVTYMDNIESGRAPFYSPAYGFSPWIYPFAFHILLALHVIALGVEPIFAVYPLAVLLIALSAIALERIIYMKTSSRTYSCLGGLAVLASNFTFEVLWGNGTYAQILAQFAILLVALELTEYVKKQEAPALIAAAFSAQLCLLAYTFFAVIPAMMAAIAILASRKGLKEWIAHAELYAEVAILPVIPFFLPPILIMLGVHGIPDPVMGGNMFKDALVSHDAMANMGLVLPLLLAIGIGYSLWRHSVAVKDDWALRSLLISCSALLAVTALAMRYFNVGPYWHFKTYFLAIYAFVLYGVLSVESIVPPAAAKLAAACRAPAHVAAAAIMLAVFGAWLALPALTGDASLSTCGQPDKAVTMDQYLVLKNVSQMPDIKNIVILSSYITSFNWDASLSNKTVANLDSADGSEPLLYLYPRYYTPSNGFCNRAAPDPQTGMYLASLIDALGNDTAFFISNFSLVVGSPPANESVILYTQNSSAVSISVSGDAAAFRKQ